MPSLQKMYSSQQLELDQYYSFQTYSCLPILSLSALFAHSPFYTGSSYRRWNRKVSSEKWNSGLIQHSTELKQWCCVRRQKHLKSLLKTPKTRIKVFIYFVRKNFFLRRNNIGKIEPLCLLFIICSMFLKLLTFLIA